MSLNRWPAPKTFINPGDEIKGTLVGFDGASEKYPVLHIREAQGLVRIIRVTQAVLHERLVDLWPELGDRIWIRYDGEDPATKRPGMSAVKLWHVEIRRADKDPVPGDGTDHGIRGSASENVSGGGS